MLGSGDREGSEEVTPGRKQLICKISRRQLFCRHLSKQVAPNWLAAKHFHRPAKQFQQLHFTCKAFFEFQNFFAYLCCAVAMPRVAL